MTSKGLRFGPAGDDQAAYLALHQALVAYHMGFPKPSQDIAMKSSKPAPRETRTIKTTPQKGGQRPTKSQVSDESSDEP
jgi:hypothetical protein